MANPSKKKGTEAESKLVKYFKSNGIDAKRIALSGNKDKGDVLAVHPSKDAVKFVFEVKAGKQTQGYSRAMKKEWLRQTAAETDNNEEASLGYLVIAIFRRSVEDWEVWDASGHLFYYLDDFMKKMKERC